MTNYHNSKHTRKLNKFDINEYKEHCKNLFAILSRRAVLYDNSGFFQFIDDIKKYGYKINCNDQYYFDVLRKIAISVKYYKNYIVIVTKRGTYNDSYIIRKDNKVYRISK